MFHYYFWLFKIKVTLTIKIKIQYAIYKLIFSPLHYHNKLYLSLLKLRIFSKKVFPQFIILFTRKIRIPVLHFYFSHHFCTNQSLLLHFLIMQNYGWHQRRTLSYNEEKQRQTPRHGNCYSTIYPHTRTLIWLLSTGHPLFQNISISSS